MFVSLLLILTTLIDRNPCIVESSGLQAPGYFLISGVDQDSLGFIDNTGRFIYPLFTGPNVNHRPTPYGGYTYYDGALQAYVTVDNNLRTIDTFSVQAPYQTDFHEGYQTTGRRCFVLGTEVRTVNMSELIQGAPDSAQVIGCVIQEFDRRGRRTFEWKSLDHIPPTEATYEIDLTHNRIDYIHANAIVEDSARNIILSCRNLDQIIKIDRSTGSIIWRLGGSAAHRNDFTFTNDTNDGFVGFSHQHAPVITRKGELLVFDNGNLKSSQVSRVVAYTLNETTLTATKTWEYIHPNPTFSPTMGSVQELPNGNILIGWGTAQNGLVATEVDRSGMIHSEVRTPTPLPYPYRVYKSPIAMTSIVRKISGYEQVDFSNMDSTTRVRVRPTTYNQDHDVSIERHNYAPTHIESREHLPCHVFPQRWVVRYHATQNVYAAQFNLARTMVEDDPSAAMVLYRHQEGVGPFVELPTSLVEASSQIEVPNLAPGEYVLGSRLCKEPSLVYPGNSQDEHALLVPLRWTPAIGADGYEVEISTSADFTQDVRFFRTQLPDTTIRNLQPQKTYYWHVRVIRQPEVGLWTQTWTFDVMTPLTVSDDGAATDLPIGTNLVVYDVLGNEIARETIVREQQHIVPDLHDKLLVIVATTPGGAVYRKLLAR
jgi:hypothetical protein